MTPGNYVEINGSKIHYLEQGSGDPILFLHGIPASSYLWRNVMPHLASLGCCIAPDLIGMGKSDKPDIEYSINDHIQYIDQFIEKLGLKHVTLVLHGWGSIIGFHYAMRHEKNCKGLVFYEAYLRPFNDEDIPLPLYEHILLLQTQKGIENDSVKLVTTVLNQGLLSPLKDQDMATYCEPFSQRGAGKALQSYLQEIPMGDKKNPVDLLIADYSKKLMKSNLPKLMLYSVPGFITTIATAVWAKEHIPNLEMIEIGEALHYAQEVDPALMGETISIWMQGIEQIT